MLRSAEPDSSEWDSNLDQDPEVDMRCHPMAVRGVQRSLFRGASLDALPRLNLLVFKGNFAVHRDIDELHGN
jgi:hypothetical protein